MSGRLERARALLDVSRPQDALRELTEHLAQEPDSVEAHALMAAALQGAGRGEEAVASARRAVALAPDFAGTHSTLGWVLTGLDRDREALESAREAVRLDPEKVENHALEANCLAGLKRWREMLEAAERGLALDPEHVTCINLRANALRMLGKPDAARAALDVALAESPEDADTHSSYGFARLQEGDVHAALEHFREALRLEPGHASARAGLIEALKARNPLYRPILWWILFTARLSGGRFVLVAVGILFGVRALARALKSVPGLEYLGGLVLFVYALIVWTSWVGSALFDLLLWLRRDTRDVLEPHDALVARCLGGTLLAAPLAAILLLALGNWPAAVLALMAFLAAGIPVAGGLSLPNLRARWIGGAIALLAVLVAALGTAVSAYEALRTPLEGVEREAHGTTLLVAVLIGAPLSTWALMGLGLAGRRR